MGRPCGYRSQVLPPRVPIACRRLLWKLPLTAPLVVVFLDKLRTCAFARERPRLKTTMPNRPAIIGGYVRKQQLAIQISGMSRYIHVDDCASDRAPLVRW
jgi:hypothetical protein